MTEIGELNEIPKEVLFEWKIKDFFSLSDATNARFNSPKFYFSGASWIIQIFPNGQTEDESGWVSLYLARRSSGSPVTVNYSFSLKNVDGEMESEKSYTNNFEEEFIRVGIPRFIKRSMLMEKKSQLLPADNLTIVCTLKSSDPNVVANSLFRRHQDMSDNLREIYIKAKRTNVKLKFNEDDCLHAHQMILESRSPVFAAMFSHDTKEKQTGEVSIDDIDKSTMHSLLLYLYSGDMYTPTTENAFSLYAAAEKYDVKYIKFMCCEFITRNLTVDWVIDVIKFAELYQLEDISRQAREFFRDNADEILESDNWKAFVKENHDLGMELLGSLVKTLLPTRKKEK